MTQHSAFEKLHVEEKDKADLGGVLEQLNLPPAAVQFVRKNQKAIYTVLACVSVIVIVWSLYGSYVESKIKKSNEALSIAMKNEGDAKIQALQGVINDYDGTDAALWAKVEIGNSYIEEKEYQKSSILFAEIKDKLSKENPLFPLVVFSIGQNAEALENYDKAIENYSILKQITGYDNLGYSGIVRIYELQGDKESAIKTLEEYSGTVIGDDPSQRLSIQEKISQLRSN